jgi:hypothetical protein
MHDDSRQGLSKLIRNLADLNQVPSDFIGEQSGMTTLFSRRRVRCGFSVALC